MEDKLQNIIIELEKRNKKEDAYFGFYKQGEGQNEDYYIKGNRDGLELYAIELLKASLETYSIFEQDREEIYQIETQSWDDENSDFFFEYIELKKESKQEIKPRKKYKETWKDKVFKIGCIGIAISIFFLLITGLISTINWFVK